MTKSPIDEIIFVKQNTERIRIRAKRDELNYERPILTPENGDKISPLDIEDIRFAYDIAEFLPSEGKPLKRYLFASKEKHSSRINYEIVDIIGGTVYTAKADSHLTLLELEKKPAWKIEHETQSL